MSHEDWIGQSIEGLAYALSGICNAARSRWIVQLYDAGGQVMAFQPLMYLVP
jgi:hypothetical protein